MGFASHAPIFGVVLALTVLLLGSDMAIAQGLSLAPDVVCEKWDFEVR